jgi:uncharacterized NAD(P)/FAD-binding protein YdhS
MNDRRPLEKPGRSDPVQGNGQPPELQAMLLAAKDDPAAREAILKAFYAGMEGAANSVAVHHGVLLSAVYNAIRHDIQAAAEALPDHVRQAAEEQGELIRKDLRAQIDQARRDEQAAREKQLSELRETVEEIRERESKVAARQAKGWQEKALNYTLVFGLGVIASPLLGAGIDAIKRFIHP